MMATRRNNNGAAQAQEITTAAKKDAQTVKVFDTVEISEQLACAIIAENGKVFGKYDIEDTLLDSRSFCDNVKQLITSFVEGNAYETLNAFLAICKNPKYYEFLHQSINYIFEKYPRVSDFFESTPKFCEWQFLDNQILNMVWQEAGFNRTMAFMLYASISYLSDKKYDLTIKEPCRKPFDMNRLTAHVAGTIFGDGEMSSVYAG